MVTWQADPTTSASVGGCATAEPCLNLARSVVFVDAPTWIDRYEVELPVFGPGPIVASLPSDNSCPGGEQNATYTIEEGDLPAGVAQVLDVTLDKLDEANEGNPAYDSFIPGAQIIVPCSP